LLLLFFDDDFRVLLLLFELEVFFEVPLLELLLLELFLLELFFLLGLGGIFAPDLRASLNPIAIACFGFFTFL
jgi:hypothetical protein